MKFRSNYEPFDDKPKISCDPKTGRTKSEFAPDCDINNIMKRFELNGVLPEMIRKDPVYGEFADCPTYQESLNLVIRAQEQFQGLPAKVRERFANDPARFLEFASDAANGEEMVRLGLATRRVVEEPSKAKTKKPEGKKVAPAVPQDKNEND